MFSDSPQREEIKKEKRECQTTWWKKNLCGHDILPLILENFDCFLYQLWNSCYRVYLLVQQEITLPGRGGRGEAGQKKRKGRKKKCMTILLWLAHWLLGFMV